MKRKILAGVIALGMAFSLAACGSSSSSTTTAPAAAEEEAQEDEQTVEAVADEAATAVVETEEAAADEAAAGFEEIPIWEDEELGNLMNVNGVYFQPVPMSDGNNYEDYNMHFEADISALENTLGYGVGDWIPYLTVDYEITNSKGEVAASGTFMPMSASDGPHYGANIKLEEADTYSVKLSVHSPAENNYLLHLDSETGPGGTWEDYFPNGDPLVLELADVWNYTPQEW